MEYEDVAPADGGVYEIPVSGATAAVAKNVHEYEEAKVLVAARSALLDEQNYVANEHSGGRDVSEGAFGFDTDAEASAAEPQVSASGGAQQQWSQRPVGRVDITNYESGGYLDVGDNVELDLGAHLNNATLEDDFGFSLEKPLRDPSTREW